ncbi:MAG: MBOAT family O-acyltransferase, partial [Vicinamibacterales bacterium]
GYSNIARGTSKLMGIELLENFRFPYLVRSPQEFWRHWHISLSTWLRDYLYIPLGGNRGGAGRAQCNLFLTMLLGGLWHGAAWTFVLWGAYHGVLLVIYRTARRIRTFDAWTAGPGAFARITSWAVMFHLTCYGWLIFRSRSVGQIWTMTESMVAGFNLTAIDIRGLAVPLALYVTPMLLVHAVEGCADDLLVVPKLTPAVRYCIYAATFYLTMLFGNFGGSDFIYFQF